MKDSPQKLNISQVLAALKADMKSADVLRKEMEGKVEEWKSQYDGDPYGNEEKGKSEIVSRDIKRQDEWQHSSIKDPFVSAVDIIKCSPVTYEDRKAAEQQQHMLNYQFCRQFNRYKFVTDLIKLFYKEGTVITKCSWQYEDTTEMVEVPVYKADPVTGEPVVDYYEEVEKTVVTVNKPYVEICRLQDIYIDPTCKGDLENCQFVIHRYETDLSTLRSSGKYKNLGKLAKSLAGSDVDDYEEEDTTNFKFADIARQKIVVYEYWGNFDVDNDGIAEPILWSWAEDIVIQAQGNPLPDKKHPFDVAANNSIPFTTHGEAAAELIGDNQKLATAIKRGTVDNLANSNNAQRGIPNGLLDPVNERRFLKGQNFKFNGEASSFYEGGYNQIPSSVFSILEMINNENESMLGVKAFSGGINGAGLGSTARAAGGVLDAVSVRRSDIVRNISENIIKPIMRKWASYNAEFLQPQEYIRVTNEEFVEINRDDLDGNIDIEIEIFTAEDNRAKSERIAFLLQTLGQGLPMEMTMMLMAQIFKLERIPDLAKQIEEYQPPAPDPLTQEQRQLEVALLGNKVKESGTRAEENMVDMRAKSAKAAVDEARVENIKADTDVKDIEFTKKLQGSDFEEEMIKKEHDRNSKLMEKQAGKSQ